VAGAHDAPFPTQTPSWSQYLSPSTGQAFCFAILYTSSAAGLNAPPTAKQSIMAPTHTDLMANGMDMDGGHSILFVLSVHFALSFESCSLAMPAMLTACCMSARILLCI